MSPKQDRIDEWCDSDVTRYLLKLLHKRLDETFMMRAETFFPGEAHKTQEQKAMLIGEESALKDFIEALEQKDLSEIAEEEQDDEQIGNTPSTKPSAH